MCPQASPKAAPTITELTYQQQADAVLNQANPVQNTWYTILPTTLNCDLMYVEASVAVAGETIEARLTVDGQVYSSVGFAFVAGTYYAFRFNFGGQIIQTTSFTPLSSAGNFARRSIKFEIRKTTANGNGNLIGRALYATR